MTAVFDETTASPQTHVIIIGVDAYRHLVGGTGHAAKQQFGLRQLSSPTRSAFAFVDWLLKKYHNPIAPLGSIELLLSQGDDPVFYINPKTNSRYKVDLAEKRAITTSIRTWFDRGDQHLDNIAIFYFCGHGLARGAELGLLAQDFGADKHSLMQNSIDLGSLVLAMEGCKARNQCFFIDACRHEPKSIAIASLGDAHVLTPNENISFGRDRNHPIYYAAARGHDAHGLSGGG
jgi:hypothetical protein